MTWWEPRLKTEEIPAGWREWNEIDVLRYELKEAISTIEFLHGCLTNPHVDGVPGGYTYAYPKMTLDHLERIRPLVTDGPKCSTDPFMSFHKPDQWPCPVHNRLMRKQFQAEFTPQAWVNDYAITVDAEGETTWDCTEEMFNLSEESRRHIEETQHDTDDLLKSDPNAPEWVREWSGPFEIHVREIKPRL